MNTNITMKRMTALSIALAVMLLAGHSQALSTLSGTYRYREVTGTESKEFSWQISSVGELVEIKVEGEDRLMVNRCRDNGETLYWSVREKGKESVTATRTDDTLRLIQQQGVGPSVETHEIDERPWFQPLSFSLRQFLFSSEEKISFWCVRQDTLEVVPLTARKMEREKLLLDGREFDALKVEIRMTGIFAPFWHGTYWYRADNGLFLRYQGANGPPGTEMTTISLMDRPHS